MSLAQENNPDQHQRDARDSHENQQTGHTNIQRCGQDGTHAGALFSIRTGQALGIAVSKVTIHAATTGSSFVPSSACVFFQRRIKTKTPRCRRRRAAHHVERRLTRTPVTGHGPCTETAGTARIAGTSLAFATATIRAGDCNIHVKRQAQLCLNSRIRPAARFVAQLCEINGACKPRSAVGILDDQRQCTWAGCIGHGFVIASVFERGH